MKSFKIFKSLDELDTESQELIGKAIKLLPHAYAPYSNFLVSSILLLEDGSQIVGTNQENAAYPSGLCAERLAVFTANSQYPFKKIKKLVIVAQKRNDNLLTPAAPCGACRQVLIEAESRQSKEFEILMMINSMEWVLAPSAASLLPFAFTSRNL
jgi:cytidine deaminase